MELRGGIGGSKGEPSATGVDRGGYESVTRSTLQLGNVSSVIDECDIFYGVTSLLRSESASRATLVLGNSTVSGSGTAEASVTLRSILLRCELFR